MTIEKKCVEKEGFYRQERDGEIYCGLSFLDRKINCRFCGTKYKNFYFCNYDLDKLIEVKK